MSRADGSIEVVISDWETEQLEVKNEFTFPHFVASKLRQAGVPLKTTFSLDVTPAKGTLETWTDMKRAAIIYRWKP
jgi:hypothetical protein